ncbi:MAG: Rpn family recombination-promoting nuclease/putative transposase [Lachnospiraceae bacterium]|nr:Rpn family recombination-promoting nuclease/putative transposase [Lachnospiraceae bacterium]
MAKSKEKKDLVEKEFMAFPDIAADVINVLLYKGKTVAEAGNLQAGPTEFIYQGSEKLRNEYEDLCKYVLTDDGINLMYLIANQSRPDGKMLLRKAGYTGGAYREQYEKKTKAAYPVIEFVLYWGKARWKGSRDSRQLFRRRKILEETWEYIDELKLHIFEMRYLPEEIRKLFQSDMRIVADFLAEGDSYRSDRPVVHKAALIRMIKVLSGETDIDGVEEWMDKQGIREEDEIRVCELFEQYVRQGREEGEKIGEKRGERIGEKRGKRIGEARRLVMDVENAMKFFKVTLEKACEGLGTTMEKYEEAKSLTI